MMRELSRTVLNYGRPYQPPDPTDTAFMHLNVGQARATDLNDATRIKNPLTLSQRSKPRSESLFFYIMFF